ncbi:MAG: hypothetical protein WB341_00905 [Terracidiphilus sp.]
MSVSLDNAMWLAGILIEAAVIGLLFYRRIWQTLPVFCSYCVWDVLSNVGVYIVGRHYPMYFQVYAAQVIIDSALLFCVLVELAWSVLRPLRPSLARRSLIIVGALILLAGAIIWPFAAFPGLVHVASKQFLLLARLQQTVATLRILFFLLLAGGSQLLSIGWRDRELQVATGLGFYSIVSVTASLLQARGTSAAQFQHLNRFVVASFLCSLVYWLVSFAQKEAERREFTPQMQNFLLAVAGAAHSTRVALTESRAGKAPKQGKP